MQKHDAPSVAVEAARSASPDPWCLVDTSFVPSNAAQMESLFALANGALGVRGSLEEDRSPTRGSFLSAVWERAPIDYHERFPGFARTTDTRVPVADATCIQLRLGDLPVRLTEGECIAFARQLDLRTGCYRRMLRWRAPNGATLEIHAERLVLLNEPGLMAIRYRVRSIDYNGPITLESAIDTSRDAVEQGDDPRIGVHLEGGLHLRDACVDEKLAWVREQTTHSGIRVTCGQRHQLLDARLNFDQAKRTSRAIVQTFTGVLTPGDDVALEKYAAYAWSTPGADVSDQTLLDRVARTLDRAETAGFPSLLSGQAQTLKTFWNESDIRVDGAAEVEQALRFNLFQLFQSSSRDGNSSTAAKGLTGEGYEGHYFWDAEAFMLPVLVSTSPALARHMLVYRYNTLEHARQHARELNHARGALYAWRTISGDECSAYFPSGSAQYHINAAIAWAIRLYVDTTGDEHFLRTQGAEMLFDTARIWLEIGHFNPRREGAFCIHEVTGPDEYSALVDNNHYTNRMAQRHLLDAVDVAQWMATNHAADYATLSVRIGLHAQEIAQWRSAAEAMYLPVDAALNIFPQDDTFLDKPRLPIDAIDIHNKHPLLLRLHPLSIYRHQVCKQADALLALMLAGEHVDVAAKRRNFDYYEQVTVHDSTLSASTFAVMAAEIGYADKAYQYFLDTLRVDLDDLHGNAAHGVHMAAMAGSWLAFTWGFGGLRVIGGKLSLAPQLPKYWNGYRFSLRWHDCHLRVEVNSAEVQYTLTQGDSLVFLHAGIAQQLSEGQSLRMPCSGIQKIRRILPLKAVIFDLDGVIADTAVVHHAAWKQLAHEIDVPFDDATGERMKGVDRRGSLDILLERASRTYTEAEKTAFAERKNDYYREQIERFGPHHLLPGARTAIESVRHAGLRTALASASRNAPLLLERLGIANLFDYVVDANHITHSKPDPEIFLAAANGLGVAPGDCLGVEDAAAGIASIHAAGMTAVGIGHANALAGADVLLPSVAAFDISSFTT